MTNKTMDPTTRKTMRRVRKALEKRRIYADVDLHIVFSCPVAWDDMAPVDIGVRFCSTCEAKVHDFTSSSKSEIITRIREHGKPLCGQVYARDDGKIVFGMCGAPNEMVRGGLWISPRPKDDSSE